MKIPKINFPNFSKLIRNIKISKLDTDKWIEQEAERKAQPFHTNYLLEDLLKSQTPKWMNITMLILTIIILGVSIWALLHSYGIV